MANTRDTFNSAGCSTACAPTPPTSNCFKEAACIDTKRIYDSVADRECLENLQVYFSDECQPVINHCTSVKLKSVEVVNMYLDVEAVPFNSGFYTVDMTFFFMVKIAAYHPNVAHPTTVVGLASFSRKVILYGSEGNVKVFCSDNTNQNGCVKSMPVACVQVSDPIGLDCYLCEPCHCEPCHCQCHCGCSACPIPENICDICGGCFDCCQSEKNVFITLGIFIIVQMERPVQLLIPTYDFCIPNKEPVTPGGGDPCELFRRIKFPTDSFFPPSLSDKNCCCDD